MSTPISFASISGVLGQAATSVENNLQNKIQAVHAASASGDVSQDTLIQMQAALSQWQLVVQLESTMIKTLSETLNSIVSKA